MEMEQTITMESIEKAQQGRVTGVIIPPPDIRAVADKTATFVAKFGKSFEEKVMASEEGKTPKFNFLKSQDPYNAYYELKIREIEEGKPLLPVAGVAAPIQEKEKTPRVEEKVLVTKASISNPLAKLATSKAVEAPPPLLFSHGHPSGMKSQDVEVIKLTAQYTAVNGKDFLSGLASREARNPQFDFLKPTHILFSYFTSMVDAYAKVVAPSSELKERVKHKAKDRVHVLEGAVRRWQFNQAEAEKKREAELVADADRIAFQSIDWQDFVVVETIDFDADELLEAEKGNEKDSSGNMPAPSCNSVPPPPPSLTPPPPPPPAVEAPPPPMEMEEVDDLNVVSNYQPRIQSASASAVSKQVPTMLDPVSGRVVPIDQVSEHMRVQLLDSRWKVEQQRFLEKQQESGLAEGASIADSLKNFASRRSDIFSSAREKEAQMLKEEEARRKRVVEAANIMQEQRDEEEIAQPSVPQAYQDSEGARVMGAGNIPVVPLSSILSTPTPNGVVPPMPVPPPAAPAPPSMPPPPPPPPSLPPMPTTAKAVTPVEPPQPPIEPPMKKTKTLQSEADFISQYGTDSPVRVTLVLPRTDSLVSSIMEVHGEVARFAVTAPSITCTVKELKETICKSLNNIIAPNKIQVKDSVSGFLKDSNSLAAYNIAHEVTLELSQRSRGGKK